MRRFIQTVLGIALATTIVACADDRANNADTTAPRDTGAAVGTAGANADRDFIQDQLQDGQAEVAIGKLASERAQHPQVKEFAQMMVRDHQMAGEELRRAATTANVQVTPSAELDGDHKELQDELTKLSGREFDKKYIDAMIEEHEEAVKEIEDKANADNAQVRQWASATLPKVQQHLDQAKQIQKTLEQAGTR